MKRLDQLMSVISLFSMSANNNSKWCLVYYKMNTKSTLTQW